MKKILKLKYCENLKILIFQHISNIKIIQNRISDISKYSECLKI